MKADFSAVIDPEWTNRRVRVFLHEPTNNYDATELYIEYLDGSSDHWIGTERQGRSFFDPERLNHTYEPPIPHWQELDTTVAEHIP